ncbi:MAG: class I SAM-dependent methyltransferase [Promethearchaeota archaeon]|jgi:SAM-dependent methyltransferase
MSQNNDNLEITLREQTKKFAVKSMYGFQTILAYGFGSNLGIFDYLYEKAKSEKPNEKVDTLSFTLEELSENLNLDLRYLDAWLHLSLVCGIFEIDETGNRRAKTAPFVYDLLIDRNSMFYLGSTIAGFYTMATNQNFLIEGTKTGQMGRILDVPPEDYKQAQHMSARMGGIMEGLFARKCKEDRKKLLNVDAKILEIGCGYGFNLEIWAKKYKKAKFVGIDIDPYGIEFAKQLIKDLNWQERVEILEIPLKEYVDSSNSKFDLIILNMVLHEMDPDDLYRKRVFENMYSLLKDDGLLLVGETMIPDTFTPNTKFQLYDIMHKVLEVGFGSKFYSEESFKDLINASSFTQAELIRERGNYFWVVRK